MSLDHVGSSGSSRLCVVVVLYRMALEDSPAYRTLRSALNQLGHEAHVLVYDNTDDRPVVRPPEGEVNQYIVNRSNGGLVSAYNSALDHAVASGDEWLMLLDQDTHVSVEYVDEVMTLIGRRAAQLRASGVDVLVPRLVERSRRLSPSYPPRVRDRPVPAWVVGATRARLYIYNSGAVVRVAAASRVGGFPKEYWLDYVDHAFFTTLWRQGSAVWLMRSSLVHSLSLADLDSMSEQRYRSIITAEAQFHLSAAPSRDRLWYVLRRLARLVLVLLGLRSRRLLRADVDAARWSAGTMLTRPRRAADSGAPGD